MTDTNDYESPTMTSPPPRQYRARITRDAEGNIHWEIIDAYHPVTGQLRRMTTTVDHLAEQMRGITLTLEESNQIIQAAARLEARLHKLRDMAQSRHYDSKADQS